MRNLLAGLVLVFAIIGYASAHKGATGVVKERMMAMKDIGGLVKALTKLDWSGTGSEQAEVAKIADKLVAHSRDMLRLFPEGSNKKPSEALDVIWKNKDEFASAIVAMEKSAANLKVNSGSLTSAEDLEPFIKDLGKTCSACHSDFRKKKE